MDIDLTVAYCIGTTDGVSYYDSAIGKEVKWGVKLLEGYKYIFLEDKKEPSGKSDYRIISSKIKK